MRKIMLATIFIFITMPMLAVGSLDAPYSHDETVQTARYSYEKVEAKGDQKELLSVVVQLQFPKAITTVGEALVYLLKPSGYKFQTPEQADDSQYFLLNLNLPEVHRTLGPIRLQDALRVLGNHGFDLVINPIQRTVGYHLIDEYSHYLDNKAIEEAKKMWLETINQTAIDHGQTEIILEPESLKHYGPVKKHETLSGIVRRQHPSAVQSTQYFNQCLIAYYQLNLSSFSKNNVNLLLEGTMLDIPTDNEIQAVLPGEAQTIIQSHIKAWKSLTVDR